MLVRKHLDEPFATFYVHAFLFACLYVFVWCGHRTFHLLMLTSNSATAVVWECNSPFLFNQPYLFNRPVHSLGHAHFLYCPVRVTSSYCHIAVP